MSVTDGMYIDQVETRRGPLFGYYLHRRYFNFNPVDDPHKPHAWGKTKEIEFEISRNERMGKGS